MTTYSFVDESGETRLRGTIDPAPGAATGADSPVGVVTPSSIGALYIDTTHGALYIAHGVTNADWTAVGGVAGSNGIGEVVGVIGRSGSIYILGGVDPDTPLNGVGPTLSDAYAQWNGNGAGLSIVGNGTDGHQILTWSNAAGSLQLVDDNCTTHGGSGGTTFWPSDPHIAGVWWDDNGTLTRSSG